MVVILEAPLVVAPESALLQLPLLCDWVLGLWWGLSLSAAADESFLMLSGPCGLLALAPRQYPKYRAI